MTPLPLDTVRASMLPLPVLRTGKVRDMYLVGEDRVLMVASDRLSAFDVVMDETVPGKGCVLSSLTAWWVDRLPEARPHHVLAHDPDDIARAVPEIADLRPRWAGRALLCRRAVPVAFECVVRGHLAGSAWREYAADGTLAGEPLPTGLRQAERLREPMFSPATKATSGHDENVPFQTVKEALGSGLAEELRRQSLSLFAAAAEVAADAGLILADTKFEFGLDGDGSALLIDEVLTPDSSRYWPADAYSVGISPPSLDKQPVRDYLDGLAATGEWDRKPPPPPLPESVVRETAERYAEIHRRLTGRSP
ncbi:MAG TPA: phosphoribosylaminoimidazolesuccinocarboxamide synthase [Longimicrobiales bacterium]|nr:phosphoribosylaminoimidazolesuccinocarboxamide synthase [Longimicrobiales bacterium]